MSSSVKSATASIVNETPSNDGSNTTASCIPHKPSTPTRKRHPSVFGVLLSRSASHDSNSTPIRSTSKNIRKAEKEETTTSVADLKLQTTSLTLQSTNTNQTDEVSSQDDDDSFNKTLTTEEAQDSNQIHVDTKMQMTHLDMTGEYEDRSTTKEGEEEGNDDEQYISLTSLQKDAKLNKLSSQESQDSPLPPPPPPPPPKKVEVLGDDNKMDSQKDVSPPTKVEEEGTNQVDINENKEQQEDVEIDEQYTSFDSLQKDAKLNKLFFEESQDCPPPPPPPPPPPKREEVGDDDKVGTSPQNNLQSQMKNLTLQSPTNTNQPSDNITSEKKDTNQLVINETKEQQEVEQSIPEGFDIEPVLTYDSDAVELRYDCQVDIQSFHENDTEEDQVLCVLDHWMKKCNSNEDVPSGANGEIFTKESIALAKQYLFFESNKPIAEEEKQQEGTEEVDNDVAFEMGTFVPEDSGKAEEARANNNTRNSAKEQDVALLIDTFVPKDSGKAEEVRANNNTRHSAKEKVVTTEESAKDQVVTTEEKKLDAKAEVIVAPKNKPPRPKQHRRLDQGSWISDAIIAKVEPKEASDLLLDALLPDVDSFTGILHSNTRELVALAKSASATSDLSSEVLSVNSLKAAFSVISDEQKEEGTPTLTEEAPKQTNSMVNLSFDSLAAAAFDLSDMVCSRSNSGEKCEPIETKQNESTTPKKKKPATKEEYYQEALDKREKFLGESHPETLECLEIMAKFNHKKGELKEAERVYRDILKRHEATLTHQCLQPKKLLITIQQLAHVLLDCYKSGKGCAHHDYLLESQGLYTRSFLLCRSEYGIIHPYTLACQNNLGTVHFEQSNFALAEELYRAALKGYRAIKQADDTCNAKSTFEQEPMVDCINNLANVLQIRSPPDLETAEELHREVMAYFRSKHGGTNANTLLSIHNLAVNILLQYQKYHKENQKDTKLPLLSESELERLNEAEELAREAYYGHKDLLGAKHPHTMSSQINLANVLVNRVSINNTDAFLEEAERLNREVLDYRREQLGPTHAQTVVAMHNLAKIYQTQRNYPEAEVLYRQALEAMQQTNYNHKNGDEHFHTMVCASKLSVMEILNNQNFSAATELMSVSMKGYQAYYDKEEHHQTEMAPQLLSTTS